MQKNDFPFFVGYVQCIFENGLNTVLKFVFSSSVVAEISENITFSDISIYCGHTETKSAHQEARESSLLSLSSGLE